jgi:hypothetical protein
VRGREDEGVIFLKIHIFPIPQVHQPPCSFPCLGLGPRINTRAGAVDNAESTGAEEFELRAAGESTSVLGGRCIPARANSPDEMQIIRKLSRSKFKAEAKFASRPTSQTLYFPRAFILRNP